MDYVFDELHRALSQPIPRRVTVAGRFLGLLYWLATGFMLGLGMNIGQVLAG